MNTCKLSWWTPKIFPHKKFKNWLYSTSHLPSRCKVHSSQITIRQPLTHISDGAIYSRIKTLLNLLSRDIKALNSFSRSRLVCRAHFDDKLCLSPFLLKIITLESLWKDFVAFHRKTRQLGGGWNVHAERRRLPAFCSVSGEILLMSWRLRCFAWASTWQHSVVQGLGRNSYWRAICKSASPFGRGWRKKEN